jgi:hypothetical protein
MTRSILLIDDLRDFLVLDTDAEITIARNSQQALDILAQQNDWDELWLDHDLGGDDTIMVVVDYLSEKAFLDEPVNVDMVFIHTSNPVGRKQMKLTLDRYGYNTRLVDAEQFFTVEEDMLPKD